MSNPSCPIPSSVQKFAQKVMSAMTDEQFEKYNLNTSKDKSEALNALEVLITHYYLNEPSTRKKDKMLNDVEAFLNDLDKFFSVTNITEKEKEEVEKQRERIMTILNPDNEEKTSKIKFFEITEKDEDQEGAMALLSALGRYKKVVNYYVSYHPKNGKGEQKISGICIIETTPKIVENKTSQQKALDTINRIADIKTNYRGTTTINGKTYTIWNYNGKTVLTQSVSKEVYGEENKDIPILSAPIGQKVDSVGRDFFNKKSPLYKDGKLITDGGATDDEIKSVIAFNYGGVYTVQGLKNLVNDFKKLEKEFNKRWGVSAGKSGNVVVYSKDIHLFGKKSGTDSWVKYNGELVPVWTQGSPDLLVVDADGIVHPVDIKTFKITDISSYGTIVNDAFERDKHFAKQESRYIRMCESYGLQCDQQPYVVLVDTYYFSGDKESTKEHTYKIGKDANGKIISLGIYKKDGEGNPTTITLGEYAEQTQAAREDVLIPGNNTPEERRKPLYIEPRLRVGIKENEDGKFELTDEFKGLRGEEELDLEDIKPYEEQVEALDPGEKAELLWITGPVLYREPPKDMVTLSSDDIDSNPSLIRTIEIKHVAHLLMYQVSSVISKLCRGEKVGNFQIKAKEIGKLSRRDVIDRFGINNIIDYVFDEYIRQEEEEYPTLDDYRNKNYDEEEWEFEDEDDYNEQVLFYRKKRWLTTHKEQLIVFGESKLLALEDSICVRKAPNSNESGKGMTSYFMLKENEEDKDSGDNSTVSSFVDRFIEGLTNSEAWMLGARHYSNKASLAGEMRRLYESIEDVEIDEDGDIVPILDPYGYNFPTHIDTTQAMQATLDLLTNCETIEEMLNKMKVFAQNPKNLWMQKIVDILETPGNESLKIKFYRHFRKDALMYSISEYKLNKQTGQKELITRVINRKSIYSVLTQQLGADFMLGDVGEYYIGDAKYKVVENHTVKKLGLAAKPTPITSYIKTDIGILEHILTKIHDAYRTKRNTDEGDTWFKDNFSKEKIQSKYDSTNDSRIKGKTFIEALTNVLHGIGILIDEDTLLDALLYDTNSTVQQTSAGKILSYAKTVVENLETQDRKQGGIPAGLTGNSSFVGYAPLLISLAGSVQERVEASVYQDQKTYYSYSNPSKLGHIVRNLKDAMGDQITFREYLENEFGRYTGWFKSVDGKRWMCDWLKQLDREEDARTALDHKVEISFIGNQYKNLGALGFQLSILANYFGSRNDEKEGKGLYRWFALPTMSNKPTNEFIRFLIYTGNGEVGYKDTIVKRVLMNTFAQECNRIADVLDHYIRHTVAIDQMDLTDEKLGLTKELKEENPEEYKKKLTEINKLKRRIAEKNLTGEDIRKLTKLKSGAKFHFLWYLNNEIADEDSNLADEIAYKINLLLTPNNNQLIKTTRATELDETVEGLIKKNMNAIVENELEEMKKIGLFETKEEKIIGQVNGKRKQKLVTVLKYQKQFGGKLGSYDEDEVLADGKDPEEALRIAKKQMEEALTEFIWQDVAANINIIQITGGDLAYYGDAVNYQKRIAQIHSPGWHVMHQEDVDDGYLRSVHIKDMEAISEAKELAIDVLEEYRNGIEKEQDKNDYSKMISIIKHSFERINVTDGQSLNSITSIKKKLRLQEEWNDEMEEAYNRIKNGDFSINNLNVLMQPRKPFTTADLAKYSGSQTMNIRKVPLQDKNSEYLIILAEALASSAGKRSKLAAISDFMEETAAKTEDRNEEGRQLNRKGIDTAHFASVGKVGVSGVIDLDKFDENYDEIYENAIERGIVEEDPQKDTKFNKDNAYNKLLKEYMLEHVRRSTNTPIKDIAYGLNKLSEDERQVEKGKIQQAFDAEENLVRKGDDIYSGALKKEEVVYNNMYVDTVPVDAYIIQQEVPAHLFEKDQLFGSQIRILGISDISSGTEFIVRGSEHMTDAALKEEYMELHAENIKAAYNSLMKELGFVDSNNKPLDFTSTPLDSMSPEAKDRALKNLEFILQKELSKDAKYGFDIRRACTLMKDDDGHYRDFIVPLLDPIHSSRIQMLLNSIIKKTINKQKIKGGSLVQVTAYDNDLNIRFKKVNEKGEDELLLTRREFVKEKGLTKESEIAKAYKEYLHNNKASIAYFECYASVPDARLEKLITKADGSMMTMEEIQKVMPKKVWKSISEMIGYRIPTEDKYSGLPLKIVGFLPKAAGQAIMMPKEITLLTGSDFDIDKMYVMLKSFNYKLENEDTAYLVGEIDAKIWNLISRYTGETKRALTDEETDKFFELLKIVVKNGNSILKGNRDINLDDGIKKEGPIWDHFEPFIEWYRERLLKESFEEITDRESENDETAKSARDNRILDLLWAVLTNRDTAVKVFNYGNFEGYAKAGAIIQIIQNKVKKENVKEGEDPYYTVEELLKLYDEIADKEGAENAAAKLEKMVENSNPHNTTLPSSKIYFQQQNMQGTQMVGIFANHNVSHAFCALENMYIDLKKLKTYDGSFAVGGHIIGGNEEPTKLDPVKGFNGTLVSKTVESALTASVDTSKRPVLKNMNITTFTGAVAATMARLGYDELTIGLFLSQPIILEVSEQFFKKRTEGYCNAETAIKSVASDLGMDNKELADFSGIRDIDKLNLHNLGKNLTSSISDDYQKDVLKAFYGMCKIANDVQELTFLTKFNSVSNAVGPLISDTMEDVDRVQKFKENIKTSCFSTKKGHTNPAEIIEGNPILDAFYKYTVGTNGASEKIFKNFFPHYFLGFKNIAEEFKKKYVRNGKIGSKLYNQLLNDYIYFALTLKVNPQDSKQKGIVPTIPSAREDTKDLVDGIIEQFDQVRQIAENKGISNMLLDQTLGGNCVRVRRKDEFLSRDTLIFNGGQLDADGQQQVRDAWSDLILMDDPNLTEEENIIMRRFGIDLFFYTLMRNGFNFNPKTMMHLASVMVRYNARYGVEGEYERYIDGIRNLRAIDTYILNHSDLQSRFCDQFIRNHIASKSIVPNVSNTEEYLEWGEKGAMVFKIDSNKIHELSNIMIDGNEYYKYITITSRENKKLVRRLYRIAINGARVEGDKTLITYMPTTELGFVNNFIEYNANAELEESFFTGMRNTSLDSIEDAEEISNGEREDDVANIESLDVNDQWNDLFRVIKNLQEVEEDGIEEEKLQARKLAKSVFNEGSSNATYNKLRSLLDELSLEEKQKIWKEFKEENKC